VGQHGLVAIAMRKSPCTERLRSQAVHLHTEPSPADYSSSLPIRTEPVCARKRPCWSRWPIRLSIEAPAEIRRGGGGPLLLQAVPRRRLQPRPARGLARRGSCTSGSAFLETLSGLKRLSLGEDIGAVLPSLLKSASRALDEPPTKFERSPKVKVTSTGTDAPVKIPPPPSQTPQQYDSATYRRTRSRLLRRA